MKKMMVMLLTATMVFSLTACGPKSQTGEEPEAESSPVVTETTPEATSEATPEPTSESTPEPTPEVQETTPANGAATIITSDALEEADSSQVRGGTNQNDAILLPKNTKFYGTVQIDTTSWFAFTTDEHANSTYSITTVNKTLESSDLYTTLYDEYGTRIDYNSADNSGLARTISTNELTPNTTYYISLHGGTNTNTTDYRLIIKNPDEQSTAYNTVETVAEARGVSAALEGEIYPGSNQDDAAILPTGTTISGTINKEIYSWFAFSTGENTNGEYKITTVNKTVESSDLYTALYDEYGTRIEYNSAGNNGVATTISTNELTPNTTYYISLHGGTNTNTTDYTLSVQAPAETIPQTATIDRESLVFETPFELTETQVMFVINEATFINETAAKTALKPVADVILAHPDHPILLAGTTATDGTQESCVELSNKRADAVKNLLISAFGVPESQIQTIGLGYEADPFVRGKDRDANGQFVETEGAKNRRVVVLDIDDPIAKELLGK